MNRINWMQVAVFGIVALLVFLVGASLLSVGWGGGWGARGWWRPGGMMGPGMMGNWGFGPLGWLFMLLSLILPLGFLALLILGAVWVFRQVSQSPGPVAGPPAPSGRTCAHCGRAVQADWQVCPYCGQALTSGGAR
jgi:hypothetical protein